MNPLFKILLAAGFLKVLWLAELDAVTCAILYILFIAFIQMNEFFEIKRSGRRPTIAWRSRYSRRRFF